MRYIDVFAPGTVANLGSGFDVMGLTLDGVGDVLRIGIEESKSNKLKIVNRSGCPLPEKLEDNVITSAIMGMLPRVKGKYNIEVEIKEKINPGSGIGSSAASSAAAAFGLNELLGRPFSEDELVYFSMLGEELIGGTMHADNSAPAVKGGVVLIRSNKPLDLIRLPVPENFYYAVVHPDIMVSTKMAREVLPERIPLHDAVVQWGNVGGLVAGFAMGDIELIGKSMRDCVVEPYRKRFIPAFDNLRMKAEQAGALAINIAGSGPSVFAVMESIETAEIVAGIMKEHFNMLDIACDTYTGKVSEKGARQI